MHKIYGLVVAMLLLAGCQQDANQAASVENAVSASNASAPPAEANAAGNGQEQNFVFVVRGRIPDEFHGVYDRDGAACATAGSEERLQITADALRFHESIGEIRGFRRENDGSILVEADFQGEGERWSNSLRLSRGAGGTLVVTQPDGSSVTRIPCP